jgi:uncharacterized repeat protein (TIGR01451 family)
VNPFGFLFPLAPKRIAQLALLLTALIPGAAVVNASLHSTPTVHATTPPPIDGASSACDTFKVSFQTVFGGFDITQFAEPGWVWVDPGSQLRSVSGVVTQSGPTHSDFPANHDSHDVDMALQVDPGYEGLISNADTGGGVAPGQLGVEWEIGTFTNETSGDPLERTFPRWAWPNVGDRAWFDGNWVFDCGHYDSNNRYNTEIHPPRASAAMRDQTHVMPGTGTTPVRVTATDLYIHGYGGFVMDDLICGEQIMIGAGSCGPSAYPHRPTDINGDYAFDICLPPQPSASAALTTSMENGPNNSIATDPVLTPQPSTGACAGPAYGPMQLHVAEHLAGFGPEETLARKIYAGWAYPPTGLKHITAKLTRGVLHDSQDVLSNCECSFFWVNVDRSPDEWYRLTPYEIPTDRGFLCGTNTLGDWSGDGICNGNTMNFNGPNFDFYVVDGQDYTFRTIAYDQDCIDGLFGNYQLAYSTLLPTLDGLNLLGCYIPPENGDNDAYDAAAVTNLAAGSGARVAPASNQFELFFDTTSTPVTIEDFSDLSLTKTCKPDVPAPEWVQDLGGGSNSALAGQQFTCTVVVNNPGPGLPSNVVVHDTMSTGVDPATYTMDTPNFTFSGGGSIACDPTVDIAGGKQFSCNAGTIPLNGSATITYHITSNEGGDFNNSASVTTDSVDPNLANNASQSSVHVVPLADVSVTKTVGAGVNPVTAGTGFSYLIHVANAGPSTATNVVVNDFVPAGMAVVSATSLPSGSCVTGVPGSLFKPTRCTIGALASGDSRDIQVAVLAAPSMLGQVTNFAWVHGDTPDPNISNNVATKTITVIAKADLSITKTADASQYKPNTRIAYHVTVTNNGPSDAQHVAVLDTLPDQKQAVYLFNTGGCFFQAPKILSCNMGTLAAGAHKDFYVYMVVKGTQGTATNAASVSSTTTDPNGTNNATSVAVTIKKP